MQINISYLTGLLLAGSLVVAGTAIASDDFLSRQLSSEIRRSDETIQESNALAHLAVGLSSGPEAMRDLRGSQSENSHNKDRLEPPIVEMECTIERIANYVSCYSSPLHSEEEAETLFAKPFIEYKPPCRQTAGEEFKKNLEPLRAEAIPTRIKDLTLIDIDIVARPKPHGPNGYIVSIFGWPGYKLAGYDEFDWHP